MTKSGRKSNAQKSHRKVQSSSARNRKSVNKPLTKSTSAKKSQGRGVKASQVRSSRAKATIQKTIDSKQKEMKRESAILETSATTSEEPVSVEVKIENKKKSAAKSEPAKTKEAAKVKNESAETEEVAEAKNESAEVKEIAKAKNESAEAKAVLKIERESVDLKEVTEAEDKPEESQKSKSKSVEVAKADDKLAEAHEEDVVAQTQPEETLKAEASAKSKSDDLEEKIAKAKVIKHAAPRDIKVNFVNEKVDKRPLSEKPVTMDVVQKNRIRHFSDVSEETVLAEMEQVGRTSSQSVALERALSNFEVEHPEISDRPIIRDFDIRRINERMDKRKGDNKTNEYHRSAKEIKESAIRNAMNNVSRQEKEFVKHRQVKSRRVNFGFKRIMLALACATAAVFAIVYFVNINAPNVSLRVAAMQSGINASYPRYVPRDFNLSDITSEQGKITMNFKNATSGDAFSLVEENSAWDSTALLNNYVRDNYDDYTIIKEQGLTIYLGGRAACWVNGGIIYKLNIVSGSLTKKQITTIATSLIASN